MQTGPHGSGQEARALEIRALDGAARALRIGFTRTNDADDVVIHRPWRTRYA